MTMKLTASVLAAALILSACQPSPDPAVAIAAQAAAEEQAAAAMATQFDAAYDKHDWELARAHGAVLLADHPGSAAAKRIATKYDEVQVKATAAREQRRLASLWSYQTEAVKGGQQLSASIYAKAPLDTAGTGPRPVRLIFRDHPSWGDSSYLTLEAGDFNCYGGCQVNVKLDDAAARPMAASRPKTDEAIAMFIEDEKALWKMARRAKVMTIEFPVKAGGTRTAVFEVGGVDSTQLPKWR